jgi:DNA primase large subunit
MQIISEQRDVVRGQSSLAKSKQATKLLSLYNEAPQEELTLDEFEMFALDRLNLMRKVEDYKSRGFEEEQMNREIREVR